MLKNDPFGTVFETSELNLITVPWKMLMKKAGITNKQAIQL